MAKQKPVFNIVYCLAGLLFLVSTGFNIYQYKQIKELSGKPAPGKVTEQKTNIDSKPAPVQVAQNSKMESAAPVAEKDKANTGEINELEYHLNAAEEELDIASEKLSDELSKKEAYRKARDQDLKEMLSNPAYIKTMRDSITRRQNEDFDPLFEKLNISKEEFEEFKGMLIDRDMEIQRLAASLVGDSSDEEKKKANEQAMEIENNYKNKISDLLGGENSEIYSSYRNSLTERRELRDFMETLPAESRINEKQADILIDSMYEARQAVYDEMSSGPKTSSGSVLNEERISYIIESMRRVNEKYVEAASSMLSPAQVEQYREYLKQKTERQESILKMSSYLN